MNYFVISFLYHKIYTCGLIWKIIILIKHIELIKNFIEIKRINTFLNHT